MQRIEMQDRWWDLASARQPGGDDSSPLPIEPHPDVRATLTERSIPVRPPDLLRLLTDDPAVDEADREALRRLGRTIASVLHHEYHDRLGQLKELYDPIDPDNDCLDVEDPDRKRVLSSEMAFVSRMDELLVRANFRPLSLEALMQAVEAPNEMGLNYVPNFALFDRLQVWVRGETTVRRSVRRWRSKFRKIIVVHDAYKRMVVVLKFKPSTELDDHVRADVLYMRMFKDVPHVDMEMHLPEQGTKVQMRGIDKAQIASPVAMGLPTLIYKLLKESLLWKLFNLGFLSFTMPMSLMTTLVVAPLSAGLNSFFGFQRAKQRHMSFMIRQLYYMTLANNGSVINRLIDSAEDEDFKEAILAYHVLWRHGGNPDSPWDRQRVDRAVEDLLRERAGLEVDFEIADALHKLRQWGLLEGDDKGPLRVLPPCKALSHLQQRWNTYLEFERDC